MATGAEAHAALARFAEAPVVGLDTETAWEPTVRAFRLALVQLALPGETLVLDPLTVPLDLLRPVIESPSVRLVAHNASFDRGQRGAVGLHAAHVVDTLTLAQHALPLPSHTLADVVSALFGVTLDKSLQRSNWRRRPLTDAQLAYAAADPWWSLRVYEALRERLTAAGGWDAAVARATLRPPRAKAARSHRPPVGEAAPPGPPLTPDERRVLAGLKLWRTQYAQAHRTKVFLVCPDRTLDQLTRERPDTLEALGEVHGLGEAKVASFGAELLNRLRELGAAGG
ncbi:MAG: ribonuclease D [Myxococcales bacterium]|nr:MAG: ribonuclease D [Myxococcales bacterium]